MKQWLNETFPAIQQRAEQEGAEIQWGNEAGLRSDEYGGRGYSLIGHTPEIRPVLGVIFNIHPLLMLHYKMHSLSLPE